MNEKIKDHLVKYCLKNGCETTDEDIIEILMDSDHIYREERHRQRWWTVYFCVAEIDDMKIGFERAQTTGDERAEDKGWEFDLDSICEVKEKKITKTIYEPIKA